MPSVQPASANGTSAAPPLTAANDAKLQVAKTALSALTGSKKGTVAGRAAAKADALKKLDALKQRLKALMLMGGDPKTVAKQAAQIAKQIAQVAKDYAAAGGTGAAASPVTPPAPAQAPTSAAQALDAQDGSNPTAPADAAAPQAAATTDQTAAAASSPDADAASASKAAAAPQPPQSVGWTPPPAAQDPDADKGDKRQPDLVIAEAKIFLATAKAIMKAAIAKAQHEHANPAELADDEATMKKADKDITEADKAVNGDDPTTGYSSDGQAVSAPAPDASSSVSIQA